MSKTDTKTKEKASTGEDSKVVQLPETREITLDSIKRDIDEINQKETFILNSSEHISFYPMFSYKKINELIQEVMVIAQQAEEKGIELSDEEFINHTLFLTVKYFTGVGKYLSDNNFEKQVQEMDWLMEQGLFDIVINDIFMPEEINKVIEHLGKRIGAATFLVQFERAAGDKLEELKFRYKDLYEQLDNEAKGKDSKTETKSKNKPKAKTKGK